MEKRHPLARRPMWQVLAIAGFSFGVFGLLLGIFPAYSPLALLIGVLIAVVGLLAAMWNLRAYSRSSRLATALAWSLMVILLAARSLALVIDPWWLWAVPLAALYFIAWALPAIRPGASALLWREQTAPRTQLDCHGTDCRGTWGKCRHFRQQVRHGRRCYIGCRGPGPDGCACYLFLDVVPGRIGPRE